MTKLSTCVEQWLLALIKMSPIGLMFVCVNDHNQSQFQGGLNGFGNGVMYAHTSLL